MSPDLGTGLILLGLALIYSMLVGVLFRDGLQLSWPEPIVEGQYLSWDHMEWEPRATLVLSTDWDGITTFFLTWTILLATPCIFFFLGAVLIKWKLFTACTFAPIWRLP